MSLLASFYIKKLKAFTNFGRKESLLIYTHLFMIVPFALSIINKRTVFTVTIIIMTVMSMIHHIFKRPGSEWWWKTRGRRPVQTLILTADIFTSLVLGVLSFMIILNKSPMFILLIFFVFIFGLALYWQKNYKTYVLYHSVWHIVVAILLILVLV